jgi:release factor glutamine methyltransferase
VKLGEALALGRGILAENNIEDASLEAEVLLRHLLGINRTQLYLDLGKSLDSISEAEFFRLVERRRQGEPSAYITGHREFYGLSFSVNPGVLIPRPESELLVEKAIETACNRDIYSIADVGTGCGAIAISLAKNTEGIRIFATDVSAAALDVAGKNCRRHAVTDRVELLHGDLLEPLPQPVDLVIANMPYVRKSEVPDAGPLSFEPALALDGGFQGISVIGALCRQAGDKMLPGGSMLLEIGKGQAEDVSDIIRRTLPPARIEIFRDYAGIERVVGVYLTPSRA